MKKKSLRQARLDKGITLMKLATELGSDVGNLSRVERGVQHPGRDLMVKLSGYYKPVEIDFFSFPESTKESAESATA